MLSSWPRKTQLTYVTQFDRWSCCISVQSESFQAPLTQPEAQSFLTVQGCVYSLFLVLEIFLALGPSLSRSYHSCFLKVWIQRLFLWEPALFNPIGQWGINCKCYKGKETTLHILSRKHHVFHFLFSFQKSHLLILWSWKNCSVFTW